MVWSTQHVNNKSKLNILWTENGMLFSLTVNIFIHFFFPSCRYSSCLEFPTLLSLCILPHSVMLQANSQICSFFLFHVLWVALTLFRHPCELHAHARLLEYQQQIFKHLIVTSAVRPISRPDKILSVKQWARQYLLWRLIFDVTLLAHTHTTYAVCLCQTRQTRGGVTFFFHAISSHLCPLCLPNRHLESIFEYTFFFFHFGWYCRRQPPTPHDDPSSGFLFLVPKGGRIGWWVIKALYSHSHTYTHTKNKK